MKLENEDDQLMAIAAHSYCLGRPTYMGRACVQWVMRTWPQMTEKTKLFILRETVDALTNNRVVGEPDFREWLIVSAWMVSQENAAFLDSAMQAGTHRIDVHRADEIIKE